MSVHAYDVCEFHSQYLKQQTEYGSTEYQLKTFHTTPKVHQTFQNIQLEHKFFQINSMTNLLINIYIISVSLYVGGIG